MFKQYQLKNYNFRLIVLVLALSIMGILVIGSAKESSQIKQIIGLGLSLVVMVVASLVDYTWLLKLQWLMYAGSIAILAAVIFFGKEVNGSRRWFEIPHIGLTFQPAELVKILMILFFAKFFMDHQEELQQKNRTVLIAVGLAAPLLLLVYKQPDLSTTICMTLIFCTMIYISGISYKWVLGVLGVALPVGIIFFSIILNPDQTLIQGYQAGRILAWLYPEKYPDLAYQQQNSIMAIGSGQLSGKGLANNVIASVKNGNFISEPQTDFIFAVAGEELGFIGSCAIIILIFLIVFELLRMAGKARDFSGRVICCGMAALIGFQSFLNIAVATGLIPNTGIPLPFVSYGLTSLVSLYAGIGIVLNVGLQTSYSNYRRD
ncbi:FtsW/RodA/SpoVE family cell cycle protein [Oscillospiraceae bacterium Marseille-Q3528]|nr:FtsW/RodA/SpoVE family cell cycle protein [Oscillospiraceae bacterium Marseille-Q3528]